MGGVCTKIRGKNRQLCAGDLDRKITLTDREIQTTEIGAPDFGEDFPNPITRWAMVVTESGDEFFAFNNLNKAVTHSFYCRYDSAVTAQNYIEFEGDRYDILSVEDLDERHEWLRLKCTILGDETKPSNFA